MTLQAELQKQYPLGKFDRYWAAVAQVRLTEKDYTHDHHLLPEKQFPQFADFKLYPENKLVANASPDRNEHSWLHRVLEECGGPKSPPSAWLEAQRDGAVKGGRLGALAQPREAKVKGGRIVGRKNAENGAGFCAPGAAVKAGRIGGRTKSHIRWHVNRGVMNPNCALCTEVRA